MKTERFESAPNTLRAVPDQLPAPTSRNSGTRKREQASPATADTLPAKTLPVVNEDAIKTRRQVHRVISPLPVPTLRSRTSHVALERKQEVPLAFADTLRSPVEAVSAQKTPVMSVIRGLEAQFLDDQRLGEYVTSVEAALRQPKGGVESLALPDGRRFAELGWGREEIVRMMSYLRGILEEHRHVASLREKVGVASGTYVKSMRPHEIARIQSIRELRELIEQQDRLEQELQWLDSLRSVGSRVSEFISRLRGKEPSSDVERQTISTKREIQALQDKIETLKKAVL